MVGLGTFTIAEWGSFFMT